MTAENGLWGAPRIHGELLKLGIAISERTVSRYLRGRPITRSQTWRTFFANHLGDRTFISPVMFADAHDDDIGVDASDLSFRPAPSIDGSCASIHGPSVDGGRSLQHSSFGWHLGHNHLQDRTGARQTSGRDPPRHLPLQPTSRRPGRFSLVRTHSASATDGTARSFVRACSPIAVRSLTRSEIESSTSSEGRTLRSVRDVVVCDVIRTAIGVLAKHRLGHANISQTSTYLAASGGGDADAMRAFEQAVGRALPAAQTEPTLPQVEDGEPLCGASSDGTVSGVVH